MKDSKTFDAAGLIEADPSRKDRLKYWTNELCRKKPHTFDVAVAVSMYTIRALGTSTNMHSSAVMVRCCTVPLSSNA